MLAVEALRLGRLLVRLQPDDVGALGLLALMVLQDSRRAARTEPDGRPVLLADQDRSLWDHAAVREGVELLGTALRRSGDRPHRFVAQAAVAACHAVTPRWEDTDWAAIVSWYDVLLAVDPSPVVALNRAVAVGELAGPEEGLRLLDEVSGLDAYAYLHASRAVLLRRLGRAAEAAEADRRAAELPMNEPVRTLLDPDGGSDARGAGPTGPAPR